jgi:chromosome segregation ATPase
LYYYITQLQNSGVFTMKDRIFTICDNLSRAGVSPTAEKVRAELGGGSFSTISPIIKQWRDSQSRTEPAQEIPAAAQAAVSQATAIIWKMATDHQAEAINAVRQECARIEREAIAERDEALSEVKRLEEQIRAITAAFDTLQAESQAQLANAKKEGENARVAEQSCQARLEAAAREIDSLKMQTREERAEAKAANEKAAELVGRLKLYEKMAVKKRQCLGNQKRKNNEFDYFRYTRFC